MWRFANGKDGLWNDCVGPSLYAKAQGLPIKLWGVFGNGRLEYYVLPSAVSDKGKLGTTHMNGDVYEHLVQTKFASWRRAIFDDDKPVHLVQDHERCLWQDRNITALRRAGYNVVANYPKCSPDLNAIEGWWKVLRDRLELTAPEDFESRETFLVRLRRTVHWLNENRREDALTLATNQKERAQDVLALEGAKTKW